MTHLRLKASVAIATAFAAGLCFAQQSGDANAAAGTGAGTSSSPSAEPPAAMEAPSVYSPPQTPRNNMRMACAGLADRQTERACKEPHDDNPNPALKGNDSGNVDDQAG